MIQIFKIFHGMDKMEMGSNFSFQKSHTRGHFFEYHGEISRHTNRTNFIFKTISEFMEFPSKSICQRWNSQRL